MEAVTFDSVTEWNQTTRRSLLIYFNLSSGYYGINSKGNNCSEKGSALSDMCSSFNAIKVVVGMAAAVIDCAVVDT